MPPSRINDLSVILAEENNPAAGLILTWTAPGDDYSDGAVAGYKVVHSSDTTDLLDAYGDSGSPKYEVLTDIRRTDVAGVQTSYQLRFPHYDSHHYLALVPVDDAGNEGKVSNLARIYLDSALLPPGSRGEGVGDNPSQRPISSGGNGGDEGIMIGILCGTFAVIAVLLWAGIWYLRRRERRSSGAGGAGGRGSKGVNATLVSNGHNTTTEHDTSSSDIDVKVNGNGGAMVAPQFSSIASGGAVGTYPGRNNNNNGGNKGDEADRTPTYWSASQLLNEHEQRTQQHRGPQLQQQQLYSTTTYHNALGPLPLDPIVEDPEDTYGISEMYNRHHLANRVQAGMGAQATSTPVKYSNMTFPRNGGIRHSHSASPTPQVISNFHCLFIQSYNYNKYLQENGILGNGFPQGYNDPVYGYAQSEPPNGIYGTLQRRPSGNRYDQILPLFWGKIFLGRHYFMQGSSSNTAQAELVGPAGAERLDRVQQRQQPRVGRGRRRRQPSPGRRRRDWRRSGGGQRGIGRPRGRKRTHSQERVSSVI